MSLFGFFDEVKKTYADVFSALSCFRVLEAVSLDSFIFILHLKRLLKQDWQF
jgi:hypothetical protein